MKRQLFAVMCILCIGILLCSCRQAQKDSTRMEVSDVWKQMPPIELGTLTCEPLEVLPWNCGRCEATSRNQWAETEAGFYYSCGGILWYAEKTDPENWIAVCGQPECEHTDMERCDAKVGGSVVLTETGFYFDDDLLSYPELNPGEGNGYGLYHKSRNGADTRLEYWIDDALLKSAGSVSAILSPEHWLYSVIAMENDGTYTASFYRVTDSGTEKILEKSTEGGSAWTSWAEFGGDFVFFSMLLGENLNCVYRFEDEELVEVNLGSYGDMACYLSGNTLRIFRPGDGYYDVDLKTGEVAAIASAQLPDSQVMMPLPNCIIETTLEIKDYPAEKPHSMVIFDGKRWRDVQLPEGLLYAGGSLYSQAGDGLILECVASDCIFFTSWDRGVTTIYRIPLGTEELVMEYCGQINK